MSALLQLAIPHFAWQRVLGVGAAIAMATLAAVLALGLVYLLRRGPYRFWWGALLTTAMLAITAGIVISPRGFAALLAAVVISACLLGGGIAKLRSHGFAWPRVASAAIGGLATTALTLALLLPGWGELPHRDWQAQHADAIALPDPGASGPWHVRTLTLMVHGNHDIKDFSDPGYAYLGELFASRGTIRPESHRCIGNRRGRLCASGVPDRGRPTCRAQGADAQARRTRSRVECAQTVHDGARRLLVECGGFLCATPA